MSAPGCRDHYALWTGSLMLILGGEGASGPGPFGRYDPEGDRWSPLSEIGRPYVGEAVWTGSEVLMWHADSVSPRSQLSSAAPSSTTRGRSAAAPGSMTCVIFSLRR